MSRNLNKAIELIADSIETGYSSLFTFVYREYLSREEKNELVTVLRDLANSTASQDTVMTSPSSLQLNPHDFRGSGNASSTVNRF